MAKHPVKTIRRSAGGTASGSGFAIASPLDAKGALLHLAREREQRAHDSTNNLLQAKVKNDKKRAKEAKRDKKIFADRKRFEAALKSYEQIDLPALLDECNYPVRKRKTFKKGNIAAALALKYDRTPKQIREICKKQTNVR